MHQDPSQIAMDTKVELRRTSRGVGRCLDCVEKPLAQPSLSLVIPQRSLGDFQVGH